METIFLRSPVLPPQPSSGKSRHRKTMTQHRQKQSSTVLIFAAKRDAYDRDYDGRFVDKNLIVLRTRIHEMKMIEKNYSPPADWMGWEKRYYRNYVSDVCEAVGLLQSQLMNIRPSLALGMVALVMFSVPTSTFMMAFHLKEIAQGILTGIHLIK